jgi:hypothetical protein
VQGRGNMADGRLRPGVVRNAWHSAAAALLLEAELDAYFFADPVAAARGIRSVAPRSGPVTTFTSNNMLVVVRSPNADLRRRIRVVLTDPEVKGTLTP